MPTPDIPSASDLKRLLAERGARPSRVRGQNFLIDASLMAVVADSAALDSRDVVLEPGAGVGNLTGLLAARAGRVVAVEIDSSLHDIASRRLTGLTNLRLIRSDILERGERIAPAVAAALAEDLAAVPGARLKVVANLPYIVSTAFIAAALLEDPVPVDIVAMVQREVADRLAAEPGTRDYGFLSVLVQAVARVERLRRVPPGAFWPPPDVESAVVRVTPDPTLRRKAGDLVRLRSVAGALFRHRRKQLGGALLMTGLAPDRDHAARILSELGVSEKDRAETLSVPQFLRLAALCSPAQPET